ncbi:hypothetical protein ACFL4G_04560 [Thermodesulfobacteriota bacterium]
MRRLHKKQDVIKLDSLLDIVTNIVGILIIILALVTMNVAQAVKNTPSEEDLQRKAASDSLAEEIRELHDRLEALLQEIEKKQSKFDSQEGVKQQKDQKKSLEELLRKLQDEKESLRRKIKEKNKELEDLTNQLEAPPPEPEQMIIPLVSIVQYSSDDPSKKAAWEYKDRIVYFCRNGCIFPYRGNELVMEAVRTCLGIPSGKIELDKPSFKKVERYFSSHDVGDEYIHIKAEYIDMFNTADLAITIEFRRDVQGDMENALRNGNSDLKKQLSALRHQDHWVMFFVFDDSFETFLLARKMAKDHNLESGWIPFYKGEKLRYGLTQGGVGQGPNP